MESNDTELDTLVEEAQESVKLYEEYKAAEKRWAEKCSSVLKNMTIYVKSLKEEYND